MKILSTLACVFLIFLSYIPLHAQTSLAYDTEKEPIAYGATQLRNALVEKGSSLTTYHLDQLAELPDIYVITKEDIPETLSKYVSSSEIDDLSAEGYQRQWINNGKSLLILASDAVGAEYALLELAEIVQVTGDYREVPDKTVQPAMEYRIVKFNLPWSPYRTSEAMSVHLQTCRDLAFWERFLDMMAENRLNVLSLWNKHPFPYMIQATNFPKATPFNEQEMDEWQVFWKALFRMASAMFGAEDLGYIWASFDTNIGLYCHIV